LSKIIIGTAGVRHSPVAIDIQELLVSRLLIQANSGGGKSWALRRMAEQLFGKVQTIIIDPEGEFFTLRDKFGYVLVGEGGETPADVRSAALLAQKVMELKISAVCDLFEAFRSRPTERRRWVRDFLFALLEVPRTLWGPLIIIIDEAHKFCPQETPKAGSMPEREIIAGCKDAMIALNTTGRKRGFCPVWATQRLAKVDKDASAEMFNRMVGMTIEDVDVDRAADLMSVSKEEKHAFRTSLRMLNPGEFYAFGRAIAKERILLKTGAIATRHPESGAAAKHTAPPPMPDAIAKLLPKLADLPKEAEDKARTEQEFKREIRELKQKLASSSSLLAKSQKPEAGSKSDPQQARTIQQLSGGMEQIMRVMAKVTAFGFEQTKVNPKQLEAAVKLAVEDIAHSIATASEIRRKEFEQIKRELADLAKRLEKIIDKKVDISVDVVRAQPPFVLGAAKIPAPARTERVPHPSRISKGGDFDFAGTNGDLSGPEQKILKAMGELLSIGKAQAPVEMVAAWSSYSPQGGAFGNPRGALRSKGLIDYPQPGLMTLTDAGRNLVGPQEPPDKNEIRRRIESTCTGPEVKILRALIDNAGQGEMPKEQLAEKAGYSPIGGAFGNPVGALRTKGLLDYPRQGVVKAADWLFEALHDAG
jgi:hypothetical protein